MTARMMGIVALMVMVGLASATAPALAQSNCKQIKGDQEGVFDPGTNTTSGPVRHAEWLNGTYVAAFRPGAAPTQDPTTVTFLGDYTLTTNQGELKVFNVYLLNGAGVGTVLGRIDPATSTGIFAGATGTLYFAVTVTSFDPFTVKEALSGEICFAQ